MKSNSKLRLFFIVLFLGGLWGFLEATLGTILHLDAFNSIFFASTAVMVPIAYLTCFFAYTSTGKIRSAFYVGIVAALIKSICFAFVPMVNKVVNPMVSILVESLFVGVAIYFIKPTKVLSVKSVLSFALMSLCYRLVYTGYSIATAPVFQSAYIQDGILNLNNIMTFVVTTNALSIGYLSVLFGLAYCINVLIGKTKTANIKYSISKFAYSPVVASLMAVIAVTVTIILK